MDLEILKVGPLKTNCYILIKDEKCLIIDPGENVDLIVERIKSQNLTPLAILLTHTHFDHIGAVEELKNIYGIKEYGHANLFEEQVCFPPFKFRVVYTPGHSSDSVSYYFEDYGAMFTGDFLFKEDIGRVDLPTSSYDDMIRSIEKNKNYDEDINIYPGHGPSSSLQHEFKNNQYFN